MQRRIGEQLLHKQEGRTSKFEAMHTEGELVLRKICLNGYGSAAVLGMPVFLTHRQVATRGLPCAAAVRCTLLSKLQPSTRVCT